MDELIKHIPELAAAIPFTTIVKKMLGPAADEVAEMWRDQVRVYRYERQAKLLQKVDMIAKKAGFTPQAVPPKILFPLLEGASFEDNEDLHTMWAALLANAASPNDSPRIRPRFIAILREMASDEAVLLNWLYDNTSMDLNQGYSTSDLKSAFDERVDQPAFRHNFDFCLDALQASRLIKRMGRSENSDSHFSITTLGFGFVTSCRPPKPKP
jgi:hypothetical protein